MRVPIGFVITALFVSLGISGCQRPETTVAEIDKSAPGKSASALGQSERQGQTALCGFSFPLTVDKVIKALGSPDHTFVDDNDTCPIGQLHSWCIATSNYKLSVLGDSYAEQLNLQAESRLLGIQKCDLKRPSKFDGFLGIRLDDSAADVKKRLDSYVAQDPMFKVWQSDEGSPIHSFFGVCNEFKYQYVLENGEFFVYFMMNKDDKLEAIVQSSFNVLVTC